MKIVKLISFFCFLALLFTACHKNKAGDEIASVTPEELRTLFRFDTQKDVYENLQSLNSFDKEKPYQIKGKTIVISRLTPEDIDALQGSFNLTVAGTVNRTPFQETLAFKGFKKKDPEQGGGEEDNTLTQEELRSIFIFDTSETVTVALASLEQFKGEKQINHKQVFIDEIRVQKQDAKLGTFTLVVTGNVNHKKDFEQTLEFTGFAPEKDEEKPADKPSDYNMAQRAYIEVTPGKNIYEVNFDAFHREHQTDNFAVQLKGFLTIHSSDNDGTPYAYTEEDMQHTSLTELRYESGEKKLYLKVKYKNYTSPELYLSFDHNEYYKTFVSVNQEEVDKYYQSGVLHYTEENGDGGYLFSQLITARNGFLVQYQSSQKAGEYINYSVKLLDSSHQELALFDVAVNGFRALTNLKNELIITGGTYSDYIRKILKDSGKVEELIKQTFTLHIKDLAFSINGTSLTYDASKHSLYNDSKKSLYFEEVFIEYHSIEKDDQGGITLNVKLSSVNGTILDAIIPIKRFLLSSDLNK